MEGGSVQETGYCGSLISSRKFMSGSEEGMPSAMCFESVFEMSLRPVFTEELTLRLPRKMTGILPPDSVLGRQRQPELKERGH